jgi:hypothetical protein
MKTFSRSPAIGRGRKGLSTAPSFLAAQLYRLLPPAFPAHGERRDAVTSLVIVLFETSGDAGVGEKDFPVTVLWRFFIGPPHGGISTPAPSRGSEKGCRGLNERGTPI